MVVFEKLIFALIVKKYLVAYGTQGFITVFTRPATGPYLSQMNPIQHPAILFL
jgi:hypothetical protein